jgi:hypothetical protein
MVTGTPLAEARTDVRRYSGYPLTYEKLASCGFDPNAQFLCALELLPQLGEQGTEVKVRRGGRKGLYLC